jgi:hypothetical protein
LCTIVSNGTVAQGAVAIDQITDINSSPGFGGVNVFDAALIGADDTAVFMNNDIVVYTLISDGSGGAGFSIPISNGENGITSTDGGFNTDIDNTEPADPVFAAIGNASGKLENGNAIRFSLWMRSDPNAPVTKEPSVEPVLKIELWKEALSGNSDFLGVQFPTGGDRVWDTDQNASNDEHVAAGQSQADWIDMNNDGDIQNGANPISQSLVTNEWRLAETTLVVDDDPLNDGLGWRIGPDFFDVTAIEEIRAVMFVVFWSRCLRMKTRCWPRRTPIRRRSKDHKAFRVITTTTGRWTRPIMWPGVTAAQFRTRGRASGQWIKPITTSGERVLAMGLVQVAAPRRRFLSRPQVD